MQDELQPIKLTLWKQVKNHRQHLSNGTRGELLSRYRPAERAERSPFASPGSGPKIRNSNEGLWRKSLWDRDTWRRWGALLTQRKGGYAGLTAGGWQNPSLSAPTERRSNAWLRGGWRWPAFLPSERKGEGWEGALAPPVTARKWGESRKKKKSPQLLTARTHAGFVNLALPVLNFYRRHVSFRSVWEESLLRDVRGKI